ncbi:PPA1309 family protein [uncultured Jatrophihabitans sp.]|uniref:PPA1309 family protein n=1 Tax=uncultured Jatrophihabitans sp. TaxID=1610747 RepID=UPI0035CAC912
MSEFLSVLEQAMAEIEQHVHAAGWDRGPALFALVSSGQFAVDDPQTAARLGIDQLPPQTLTPIEQEDLPDQPLDEVLAGLEWPAAVLGCAVTQEIVILPPSAEAEVADGDTAAAAAHPERREARIAVGVLRDGSSAALLRLRSTDGADEPDEERLTGADLAPNLVEALLATLS